MQKEKSEDNPKQESETPKNSESEGNPKQDSKKQESKKAESKKQEKEFILGEVNYII